MDTKTIIATAMGGLISALISWITYLFSGRALAKEARQLHDLNVLLLRAFEEAGLARLNRDATGRPVGLVIQASTAETASANDSCDV